MQSRQLPVLDVSGDLVQYIDSEKADALPWRYKPRVKTKTKKGRTSEKITGYTLVPFASHLDNRPFSRLGMGFEQLLPCGNVCYALGGTPGSESMKLI